jgi:hypothetical protein
MAEFPIFPAVTEARLYNILFCSGCAWQVTKLSPTAQAPLWAEWRASFFQDKKGWIAQLEEGLPYTQEVTGSNPVPPTNNYKHLATLRTGTRFSVAGASCGFGDLACEFWPPGDWGQIWVLHISATQLIRFRYQIFDHAGKRGGGQKPPLFSFLRSLDARI